MSLINDALKRTKQAQQENPPATPSLEFQPADPGQQASKNSVLLCVGLTCIVAAILGLSGLLVHFVAQSKSNTLPVAARVVDHPIAPAPISINPPSEPTQAPPAVEPTVSKASPSYIERPDEPNTNGYPVAAVIPEPPKPAPMKLQGIFFNPQNPSAVVSGRSVYLGDRVNGYRVMGISPVAVTLVSATETNVLSLSGQ